MRAAVGEKDEMHRHFVDGKVRRLQDEVEVGGQFSHNMQIYLDTKSMYGVPKCHT